MRKTVSRRLDRVETQTIDMTLEKVIKPYVEKVETMLTPDEFDIFVDFFYCGIAGRPLPVTEEAQAIDQKILADVEAAKLFERVKITLKSSYVTHIYRVSDHYLSNINIRKAE